MSTDEFDDVAKAIAKVEADTLEKLRAFKGLSEPLDDETMTMIKEVNAVVAAERELIKMLGRSPSIEEIAAKCAMAVERVQQIRKIS